MATLTQEAIDTFVSITGASNSVAVRILQAYYGNLNVAVNKYFTEGGDQNLLQEAPANIPQDNAMDIDDDDDAASALQRESHLSRLSEARPTVPFLYRDPNFQRSLFDSDPREVRQIPIEVKDSSGPSGPSNDAPSIEDPDAQGEEIDDDSHSAPTGQKRHHNYNDLDEEMIRAAIAVSKMENGVAGNHLPENHQPHMENDDDVTKAAKVQSSDEEVLHSRGWKASTSETEASEVVSIPGQQGTQASNGRFAAPSLLSEGEGEDEDEDEDEDDDSDSDSDYVEEEQEQPLVRRRPRRAVSGSRAPANEDLSGSPVAEGAAIHSPDADYGFTSEWGGISSVEHDEAVMLEAAMFGGIPDTEYRFPYAPHLQRMQRPPSPSLTAQRLIREQQDDEYLASLEADRVKAEARQLEEEAARVKALKEAKRMEEEARRKVEEEQELERQLVSKEASLPQEPPAGEENTITLLVRLPDGTRHGRRFLKSDKLQSLLDFVDICRVVKPNTYRLVRPYPRHAFGDGESSSTLNEIGLTSKQEALFLELI
ncbi:Plant UBX domain-containing protein 13 [Cardamine amara subsp. amara]|uniref:Plant UBX domain-containing protein 13 n=1 Tax=Cardamine amara subsp. amara TaxID=228776 RepID=A0ABD1A478_CARAN